MYTVLNLSTVTFTGDHLKDLEKLGTITFAPVELDFPRTLADLKDTSFPGGVRAQELVEKVKATIGWYQKTSKTPLLVIPPIQVPLVMFLLSPYLTSPEQNSLNYLFPYPGGPDQYFIAVGGNKVHGPEGKILLSGK